MTAVFNVDPKAAAFLEAAPASCSPGAPTGRRSGRPRRRRIRLTAAIQRAFRP